MSSARSGWTSGGAVRWWQAALIARGSSPFSWTALRTASCRFCSHCRSDGVRKDAVPGVSASRACITPSSTVTVHLTSAAAVTRTQAGPAIRRLWRAMLPEIRLWHHLPKVGGGELGSEGPGHVPGHRPRMGFRVRVRLTVGPDGAGSSVEAP